MPGNRSKSRRARRSRRSRKTRRMRRMSGGGPPCMSCGTSTSWSPSSKCWQCMRCGGHPCD